MEINTNIPDVPQTVAGSPGTAGLSVSDLVEAGHVYLDPIRESCNAQGWKLVEAKVMSTKTMQPLSRSEAIDLDLRIPGLQDPSQDIESSNFSPNTKQICH